MQSRPPQVRALVASGTCVLAVGTLLACFLDFGPHARHMAAHILAMNIVAPVLAVIAFARRKGLSGSASLLWSATVVQILMLWVWHAPIAQNFVLHSSGATIVAHAALLLAATAFWASLLSLTGFSRWQAIPALLLTGKLVCLLAALLVFSPRALYGSADHAAHGLGDQHLAGLLMLAACPLSYLIAAVVMTVHLIGAHGPPLPVPPISRPGS
jgi:putative membrane protein